MKLYWFFMSGAVVSAAVGVALARYVEVQQSQHFEREATAVRAHGSSAEGTELCGVLSSATQIEVSEAPAGGRRMSPQTASAPWFEVFLYSLRTTRLEEDQKGLPAGPAKKFVSFQNARGEIGSLEIYADHLRIRAGSKSGTYACDRDYCHALLSLFPSTSTPLEASPQTGLALR